MELLLSIVGGLVLGAVIGYFVIRMLIQRTTKAQVDEMNKKADLVLQESRLSAKRIVDEAKTKAEKEMAKAESKNELIKQKKIQEAKEKFAKLKSEYDDYRGKKKIELKERETEIQLKEKDLQRLEKEIQTKADGLESLEQEHQSIRENLDRQVQILAKKREELDRSNEKFIEKLESIAKLSEAEAKEQLLEAVKAKAENEAMALIKERLEEAKSTASKEAKKLVIQSIQRMSAEFTIENTVTVFNLDSDDIKGQIIGREGRNIRALEAATGAEIVVDDTPEAIVISSFDPIRREICRLALKRLVADGRIHPARIEEVVTKTKKQLEEQIKEIGERTVIDLDIHGLDPALVRMIGRMRFRSSYGQNLLKHSIETANLCAIMAAEIGLPRKMIKLAKRAGLLHDIGKVAEEQNELSHAIAGMNMAEKFKENPYVCNAIGAHHDEIEMNNILSPIVQACDAISGARPGARREILDSYLERIKDLEELALGYDGVHKAYALQAGRELRVIVESEKVSDEFADDLAFIISQRIQDEMQYPGQIKVTVIREKRAVSVAK